MEAKKTLGKFWAYVLSLVMVLTGAMSYGSINVSAAELGEALTSTISSVEAGTNDGLGEEGEYTLVWSDDFEGTALNMGDWNYEPHEPGWVNNELQEYTTSTDNIFVEDGDLVLKAIKTVKDGADYYTSGKVTTQNKHDFLYGKMEARIKVPEGQGLWPAFWMMPTKEQFYGQWPLCGEIDIMEILGHETDKLYGTIHYGNPHKESQGTYILDGAKFSDDYHTYAVEWEPGKISWYIDDILFHEEDSWYTKVEGDDAVAYPAPFDQTFYLQFNLAVGGSWPGNPDESTDFENAELHVDYVKVWQKESYDENVSAPEVVFKEADLNGNYITNGDFSVAEDLTDTIDWQFLEAEGGEGTATIAENVMSIESTAAGTALYSVQLVQPKLPMIKGNIYKLTFDAKAAQERKMVVDISAPDNGWIRYLADTSLDLGTVWDTYEYSFTMTDTSDANGRLEFNLGAQGSTATVDIRNVKLEVTGTAEVEEEGKSVLSDGNYIYNGTFDRGEDRLDYWVVSDAAKVSVTNVLNTDGTRTRELKAKGVTVSQPELALLTNYEYAFSLDAYADSATTIKAIIAGQEYDIAVGTQKQNYKYIVETGDTITNSDVTLQFGTDTNVYVDNISLKENAMLINGEFNLGMVGWEHYALNPTNVSTEIVNEDGDKVIKYTINNTGDADWHIQLKQNNVILEEGKSYKLSFYAKSDRVRKLQFALQRDGSSDDNWTSYSGTDVVNLTTEYAQYSKTFTMSGATDKKTILSISMGALNNEQITELHSIWMDSFVLEEVEAESNEEELILNGDFSAGQENWTPAITTPGAATTSFAKNAAVFNITNVGDENWNVQLKQSGLNLVEGEKYVLKVVIESAVTRFVDYCCMGNADTKYAYYAGASEELTANVEKTLVKEFTMSGNDANADFVLSLGKIANRTTNPGTVTVKSISLCKIKETPEEDNTVTTDELLVNRDFSEGQEPWFMSVTDSDGAAATADFSNGYAEVDVTNVGSQTWHIQLKQAGVKLVKGQEYILYLKAKSDVTRNVDYCLQGGEAAGYVYYGGASAALVAGEEKIYKATFTMNAATDSNAEFIINLGKEVPGKVTVTFASVRAAGEVANADTASLSSKVTEVSAYLSQTDKYTEATLTVLGEAIAAAEAILENVEEGIIYTDEEVAAAVKAIEDAVAGLVEIEAPGTDDDGNDTTDGGDTNDGGDKEDVINKVGIWAEDIEPQQYTGSAIKVQPKVYDGNELLTLNKDYTLKYKNNKKVSTEDTKAIVIINGKGNYKGTYEVRFDIVKRNIEKDGETLYGIVKNGNTVKVKPTVTVDINGKTKKLSTKDYILTYSYVDADDKCAAYDENAVYSVTATAKETSSYTGSITYPITFVANKNMLMKNAKITVTPNKVTANGSAQEPEVVVKAGGVELTKDTDYTVAYKNNKDAGKASVLVTGINGKMFGTKEATFTINGINIKKAANVKGLADKDYRGYAYDVKDFDDFKVVLKEVAEGEDGTLKEGVDYSVSYKNNTRAGKATVTVTGIGQYSGKIVANFKINKVDVTDETKVYIDYSKKVWYSKAGAKADVVFVKNLNTGKELVEGVDYKVSYKNNKKAGEKATVIVKGIGGYTGTYSKDDMEVVKGDAAFITVEAQDAVANTKYSKIKVTVKDNGKKLTRGKEYTLSFSDKDGEVSDLSKKTVAGEDVTVKVILAGDNYNPVEFTNKIHIGATNISKVKAKVAATENLEYTGQDVKPTNLEVTYKGDPLTAEQDYTIVGYNNNTQKGTATVIIKGINNYCGTKTIKFKITEKKVEDNLWKPETVVDAIKDLVEELF